MSGDSNGYENIFAPTSSHSEPTSGASTAAYDITGGSSGNGIYNFAVKGADVHILFGATSSMDAATTSNGFYLAAGTIIPWRIDDNRRYCRMIATTTVSGQAVTIARSGG
jgi:hypothetical protein